MQNEGSMLQEDMDMQDILNQLCKKIDGEAKRILSVINTGSDFSSDVFDSPVVIETWSDSQRALWGKQGIYVFMVRDAVTLKYEQVLVWNETLEGAKFRKYQDTPINDGDCLYLGSCVNKSLYSRVKEHFSANGSYKALKLSHPARNILLGTVYCIAFPIRRSYTEGQYRILLPALEKRLHDDLLPLCGSSRV